MPLTKNVCPACKKEYTKTDMACCDACDQWYHYACVGVNDSVDNEEWICKSCVDAKSLKDVKKDGNNSAAVVLPSTTEDSTGATSDLRIQILLDLLEKQQKREAELLARFEASQTRQDQLQAALDQMVQKANIAEQMLVQPNLEQNAGLVDDVAIDEKLRKLRLQAVELEERQNVARPVSPPPRHTSDIFEELAILMKQARVMHTLSNPPNPISCFFCNKEHETMKCFKFQKLPLEERWEFVKKERLCFVCLASQEHRSSECPTGQVCSESECGKRHNRWLHSSQPKNKPLNANAEAFVVGPENSSSASQPSRSMNMDHQAHSGEDTTVYAKVVPIRIYGVDGKYVDDFAFLDDGSSLTMMDRQLAEKLNLHGEEETLRLRWTKGITRTENTLRCDVTISGNSRNPRFTLQNVFCVSNLDLAPCSQDGKGLASRFRHLNGRNRMEHLVAKYRRRWKREHLPVITKRYRDPKKRRDPKVGNVVLLAEGEQDRNKWKLARIDLIHPSSDEIPRVVDVRLGNGELKTNRSIGNLALLDGMSSADRGPSTGGSLSSSESIEI